ncbi:MAG TPA: zf-HC2 domain-containing protein [Acidimicrobiales bacterium]|nr:zf-HC2 domain-containing protein [Acidimicrobiales bacterium]
MRILNRDMVCREAVGLVTDYLDDALPRRARRRFEVHLRNCPNCSRYLEQIRITIDTVGHIEPDTLDPEVKDELIDLYRRFHEE